MIARKEVINLKKLFLGLLLVLGLMVFLPRSASAHTDDNAYRLAYKPYVTANKEMTARINNHSMSNQNRLVCVEAWNNASGAKTHLGCLWLGLDGMGGTWWGKEFNAPTYLLKTGSYTVRYTYKASDGFWHTIKSVNMTAQSGSYTAM